MARTTVTELIDALERARVDGPAALVFDADGTLWAGDVSEDVFEYAVQRELLREEALEALREDALAHGVEATGSASHIAGAIFEAYRQDRYPERDVCAMMTWCYAGFSVEEVGELARTAMSETALESRLQRDLEPVVEWARDAGLRTVIVSASPRWIVAEGARLWGFAPHDIAASTPELDGTRVAPRLSGEVPYAEHKIPFARGVIGDADWLASFGDNLFDEAMLKEARVGVAVHPKPAMRVRLQALPDVLVFDG